MAKVVSARRRRKNGKKVGRKLEAAAAMHDPGQSQSMGRATRLSSVQTRL